MSKVKGFLGDLRVDSNRIVWVFSTHGWDKLTDEDGIPIDHRYSGFKYPIKRFTPDEEKMLKIRDKRSVNDRLLDTISELNADGENESLHILDRIDALLELAQITQRDAQVSGAAIRKARDLIRDAL
jgi:hypothetical protein